ncbi:hypothetical protein THRCLA_07802 [Thraustotheca clavata]|uniref:Uncharacterized protein n=1 Tax=Thraustotheca clavata TaxID=74557 RepID=A0A1V9ZCD6_9STRA|nr:hypothetical protein THRCLA_07802 [Thraustotheca clavata]
MEQEGGDESFAVSALNDFLVDDDIVLVSPSALNPVLQGVGVLEQQSMLRTSFTEQLQAAQPLVSAVKTPLNVAPLPYMQAVPMLDLTQKRIAEATVDTSAKRIKSENLPPPVPTTNEQASWFTAPGSIQDVKPPSQTADVKINGKPCWFCRKIDGLVLPCPGCLVPSHSECIGGHTYCGSCRITQATPMFEEVTSGDMLTLAMANGIKYIYSVMSKNELFSLVGHVSVLHLIELSILAPPAIKPIAQYYIPQFTQRWLRDKTSDVAKKKLSTKDLINAIVGLYSLKRANVSNALVEAIAEQVAEHTVIQLLGWDPRKELPNVRYSNLCGSCGVRNDRRVVKCPCGRLCAFQSLYEGYRSTFVIVYHAEQVGIPIGCNIVDVIQHWAFLRKCYIMNPSSQQEFTLYGEQVKMICSLLDLLSHHGTRKFTRKPFEMEYKLLFNVDVIKKWMELNMFDQIGTALHCMQLFRDIRPEDRMVLEGCRNYVTMHQQPNGSWGFVMDNHRYVDILRYKATHSCIKALMTPVEHGFGPSNVDVNAYLQQWTPTPTQTPSGLTVGNRSFDNLRKIYQSHFVSDKDDSNALRVAIHQHLSNLLQKSKEKEPSTATHVSRGWMRFTRDVWDRDSVIESCNVLTMTDLSIFDGLKFEDGEVLIANEEALKNDDDLLINDDDDDDDEAVADDDEETKQEWQ